MRKQHQVAVRRMAGIAAGALMLTLAGTVSADPATAARTTPASGCAVQQVTGGGQARQLAGSVPVLFVHGMNSSPGVWQGQSPTSLAGQVAQLPGMTAWTFDYEHQSLDWVTNTAVGPALASAIGCLVSESGHSVIVVAHSLGGLAAQYAIGQPGVGATDVAELITIGTPYTGSKALTVAEQIANGGIVASFDNPTVALVEAALSACAGIATHSQTNPCWLASVIRAPVGTALESNSAQIQQLPAWPSSLPVLDTAGNLNVFIGIDHVGFRVHPGDGAVTLPSATGYDTVGSPFVVSCNATMTTMFSSECFHTQLPEDGNVISRILAAIRADRLLAPGTYQVNRQIGSMSGWLLTLSRVQVSASGAATFFVNYKNVSAGSPGTLTCTGVTDPALGLITLSDGREIKSMATYCSKNPGRSTINVPSGQSFTGYGIFPTSAGLAVPFSFSWQIGLELSGTVSDITLGG